MNQLYVLIYYSLVIGLVLLMIYQGVRRRVDLLSFRNIYLSGFIFFLLISCSTAITTDDYGPLRIDNIRGALRLFLFYVLVYLCFFLISYHWLKLARWGASKFKPKHTFVASDWMLLLVSFGFFGLGVFLRFFAHYVPLMPYFAGFVPALPAACALVGWVWGGRRFNLAVLTMGGFIVAASIFLGIYGIAGRRPLIEISLAFAWGAYHRMRGNVNIVRLLMWSVPILLVAVHLLGAFTIHRTHHRAIQEAHSVAMKVLSTSPVDSFGRILKGHNDATFALWTMDAYPNRFDQRHLFSFRYMIYHPIPRALWPDKPSPLSKYVARYAGKDRVNLDLITLPPCVTGYATPKVDCTR